MTRNEKLKDYDGFVEKFKPKKTTDDCYTPPTVYDAVKAWVDDVICPLEGKTIVRPFYPGGDYEHYDYPEGCIVLDNPPFSILSKICRFYQARGIKYFLFAPSLTLFASTNPAETFIVSHCDITYENGAAVRTSFRTNLLNGRPKIMVAGDLYERVNAAQIKVSKSKRGIIYPNEVISSALLGRICVRGLSFDIQPEDCTFVRSLDNAEGGIYGGGFLLSKKAAAERAAAERAAAE
ncbi:MAG: chromosome partitioning protein ParB, partial [Bacteroides sp.]|nr:chromosome partitioning protein ParB [Bacteroides sp.]